MLCPATETHDAASDIMISRAAATTSATFSTLTCSTVLPEKWARLNALVELNARGCTPRNAKVE